MKYRLVGKYYTPEITFDTLDKAMEYASSTMDCQIFWKNMGKFWREFTSIEEYIIEEVEEN